jgi:hypothetical protein
MDQIVSDEDRIRAFCSLLQFLQKDHLDWAKEARFVQGDKQQKLNRDVAETLQVIQAKKLRNITELAIKERGRLELGLKDLLFLKPPSRKIVLPVLSLRGDLRPDLKIHMALFTYNEEASLAAIGFRFETPEQKGKKHIYHHAQMIRTFGTDPSDEILLPCVPRWLSDSLPAFPLSATTPFSLFLGVLVALYGFDYLDRAKQVEPRLLFLAKDLDGLKYGCGYR